MNDDRATKTISGQNAAGQLARDDGSMMVIAVVMLSLIHI